MGGYSKFERRYRWMIVEKKCEDSKATAVADVVSIVGVSMEETIEAGVVTGVVTEAMPRSIVKCLGRKTGGIEKICGENQASRATAWVTKTTAKEKKVEKVKIKKKKKKVILSPVEADAGDGVEVCKVKGVTVTDQEERVTVGEDKVKTGQEKMKQKVVQSIKLGSKVFNTREEMYSYFYHLLYGWKLDQNLDQHEFEVLNDLVTLSNPHKVAGGIVAFQVRIHPDWQSRCYFLIRKDGSDDDFSFRKCVNTLMPLPENLFNRNCDLNLKKHFPGQRNTHNQVKRGNESRKEGLALHMQQQRRRCPLTCLQWIWWWQ